MTLGAVDVLWQSTLSREWVVTEEIWRAHASLDRAGALELAQRATSLLEVSDAERSRRHAAIDALETAASLHPGVLAGLHGRLLESGILDHMHVPGVLFHAAGPGVHDRLVAMAEGVSGFDARSNLVRALAWIDHDSVRSTFRRWLSDAPPWLEALALSHGTDVSSLLSWVAADAGWSVDRKGRRRSLFRWSGRLLRTSGKSAAASAGGRFGDQRCPLCGSVLAVLVDVALDHSDTAFLELPGRGLRIPTCESCVCCATVYFDVDFDGGARWSKATHRPDYVPADNPRDEPHIAPDVLGLADPLTSPFSSLGVGPRSDGGGSSRIGGMPGWIQNPEYPPCPSCGELMPFFAAIDTSAVAWGEGVIYTFLDPSCRMVASVYQQT